MRSGAGAPRPRFRPRHENEGYRRTGGSEAEVAGHSYRRGATPADDRNDDVRRLVPEHAEAIGAATTHSVSHEGAGQALGRVGGRYKEAHALIETLLSEEP